MRAQLVRIGNSQGLRIPKPVIAQLGLGSEVEMAVERDRLIIRPVSRARRGWDAQFQQIAEQEDGALLDEPVATEWDESEWMW